MNRNPTFLTIHQKHKYSDKNLHLMDSKLHIAVVRHGGGGKGRMVLWISTNVSDGPAASFFRVKD